MSAWCVKCGVTQSDGVTCSSCGGILRDLHPIEPKPKPGLDLTSALVGALGGWLFASAMKNFMKTQPDPVSVPDNGDALVDVARLAQMRPHTLMGGACIVCEMPEDFIAAPGVTVKLIDVPCTGPKPHYVKWRILGDRYGEGPESDIDVVCESCADGYDRMASVVRYRHGSGAFCSDCGLLTNRVSRIDRRSPEYRAAMKELNNKDPLQRVAEDSRLT